MRRWSLFASLALTAVIALTAVMALAECGTSWVSYPPPTLVYWSAQAAAGSTTPQQAFALGMRLDLCSPVAARSITTTWLASGPTFGVVWVVADCRNNTADPGRAQALFLVRQVLLPGSASDQWLGDNAGFILGGGPPASPMPSSVQAHPPSWLSLPPDAYRQILTLTNTPPLWTIASWISATHVFITGRFEARATPPSTGASTMSVAGHAGWLVEEQGMASVVVPLSKEWTFFFSGTTTGRQAQLLATETLSHLDTVLPLAPSSSLTALRTPSSATERPHLSPNLPKTLRSPFCLLSRLLSLQQQGDGRLMYNSVSHRL